MLMIKDIVTIHTKHGYMRVYPKFFEVASIPDVRKLLKLLLADYMFSEADELAQYFTQREEETKKQIEPFRQEVIRCELDINCLRDLRPKRNSAEMVALKEKRYDLKELKADLKKAENLPKKYARIREIYDEMRGKVYEQP